MGRILRRKSDMLHGADIGKVYHQWSKPKRLRGMGKINDWGDRPEQYKEYAGAERISLPPPGDLQSMPIDIAIQRRRSVRYYANQQMSLYELSYLLYYTGGINSERRGRELRSAPSAGALFPIEVYALIHRVEGLKSGLYHYAVKDHALELIREDDLREEISKHALSQDFLGEANLVLVFSAIFQRLRWKYEARSYRYALLEAGHLGQNVYLLATSMGMGACAVGAYHDDEINDLIGVDGEDEAALYILSVGKV